jgi:hypothetical protein
MDLAGLLGGLLRHGSGEFSAGLLLTFPRRNPFLFSVLFLPFLGSLVDGWIGSLVDSEKDFPLFWRTGQRVGCTTGQPANGATGQPAHWPTGERVPFSCLPMVFPFGPFIFSRFGR